MQKLSYDLSLKSFNHNITPYIQKASDSSDRERQIFSIFRKKFALERGKIAKKHVDFVISLTNTAYCQAINQIETTTYVPYNLHTLWVVFCQKYDTAWTTCHVLPTSKTQFAPNSVEIPANSLKDLSWIGRGQCYLISP